MPRRPRTEAIQTLREVRRFQRKYRGSARFEVTFTLRNNVLRIDIQAHLTLPHREIALRAYKLVEYQQKRRQRQVELVRRYKHRATIFPYIEETIQTLHRRPIRQRIEEIRRVRHEVESRLRASMRAELKFKEMRSLLQDYIFEVQAIDRAFLTLTPEERAELVSYLIDIARGNRLFAQQVEERPLLRYLAQRYVLFYQKKPLTHNIYALRLTPLMFYETRGRKQQYYAMKIFEAFALKMAGIIGYAKRLPFQVYRYFGKRGREFINSLTYANIGEGNRDDNVILARNDMHQPVTSRPLYDVVFRPHEIKKAVTRMLGLRELYDEVRYPSIYSMIERRTRIAKLYDNNANMVLYIGKQRRRFKEIIAKRII